MLNSMRIIKFIRYNNLTLDKFCKMCNINKDILDKMVYLGKYDNEILERMSTILGISYYEFFSYD